MENDVPAIKTNWIGNWPLIGQPPTPLFTRIRAILGHVLCISRTSPYVLPYNENIPLVCMDEQPCQLLDEKLAPLPLKPGKPVIEDYEYVRNGTCSIFIFTEPLAGWRHVHVSER